MSFLSKPGKTLGKKILAQKGRKCNSESRGTTLPEERHPQNVMMKHNG